MVGFLLFVLVVYVVVFTRQDQVLRFLVGEWEAAGAFARYFVAAAVFGFVPIVAYSYGRVARAAMKLIKME
jgi:hypothetical protein